MFSQIVTQTVVVVAKETRSIETQTPPDRAEMSTQTEDSFFQPQLPPPIQLCQESTICTPSRKRQNTTHDNRQTEKRSAEQREEEDPDAWSSGEAFSLDEWGAEHQPDQDQVKKKEAGNLGDKPQLGKQTEPKAPARSKDSKSQTGNK